MSSQVDTSPWDLGPAISLLNALTTPQSSPAANTQTTSPKHKAKQQVLVPAASKSSLGDFSSLWDYLGRPQLVQEISQYVDVDGNSISAAELDADRLKGVRWRDELDGADLEDNVELAPAISAASLATQKRAARRARAKEKAAKLAAERGGLTDTATDIESANELESLRRSPDRRSVIQSILGRPRPQDHEGSPPTSPSPPKAELRTPLTKLDFLSPFLWQTPTSKSPSKYSITPQDGLTPEERKRTLITKLIRNHESEKKYLKNPGLPEPAFTPLNTSPIGIHTFIDLSNITIGFHDCLKLSRGLPLDSRIRRVPMSFHNFSLVLERGRPAAKRVLVGSDKIAAIQDARAIGYETNILERVHKSKEMTPRQKRFRSGGAVSGNDGTSGSETPAMPAPEKWVEQAVDEILHLKILESLIDAEKPSTIVLATGDAAEAEYSGGFMRMVERALAKGWMVELVSFRLNTSSAYKRREFRQKWGAMFKWIQLDDYAEEMIHEEE